MADISLQKQNGHLDSAIWGHKWGFRDTLFELRPGKVVYVTGERYELSGREMPDFIPFVEEVLGVTLQLDRPKPERPDKPVPEPSLNAGFMQALQQIIPAERCSSEPAQRLLHSHGQTTADEVYKVLYDRLERVADLVVYLESEEEAVKLVALANEHDVCLVPYGGGTSVSCALQLPASETRMIVAVDTRRMNQVEWIDRENLRASVQAGITGSQLEEALGREGFTCGHEPDSVELSTLGGWIATHASGMKKNRYGNIEDIVESVSMVTPSGVLKQWEPHARVSVGIQPQLLFFGSEGNLGLITRAVIRVHRKPEAKQFASIVFPTFRHGTEFLYELAHSGVLPASIRLLDNVQFKFGRALKPRASLMEKLMARLQKVLLSEVLKFDLDKLAAATVVMEGSREEVAHEARHINRLARKHGGVSGGAQNGKRGYMLTYAIAYIRDFLANYDVLGETYETTVPWSRIHDVIEAVAEKALEMHRQFGLPGRPYVSPRITQVYHSGVCIYFTHGFCTQGVERPEEVFKSIEHVLRETILKAGGSLSHHHGVGKIRKDFMDSTLSPASIELLRDVKRASDPRNVFGIRNNVFFDDGRGAEKDAPVTGGSQRG